MKKNSVLFIGNSYTYCNNLPGMVRELANAAGRTTETAMVASGGKSLEWHLYNPETLDAIDKGGWDFVVLQDYSLQAVEEPDKLLRATARLAARVRAVAAKPYLYVTWARQQIPEMQDPINDTYERAARAAGAGLAPVGSAWRSARAALPGLALHTEDRSHPNWLGSYLAACVFYAALFETSPVGLPRETKLCDGVRAVVDRETAERLQEIAWATVRKAG